MPGVLEAKGWGTQSRPCTTVSSACRSLLLVVPLLMLLLASANNSVAACQWLPVQRRHCGQLCRCRGCPLWFGGACMLPPPCVAPAVLALLLYREVHLLSINMPNRYARYGTRFSEYCIYTYFVFELCFSAIICYFLVWLIMCVIIHLFMFRRPPPKPLSDTA